MLRFSLKTEYGLRALMELAGRRAEAPIPAREIALSQSIPLRFLERQLAALHKAGFVESTRGAGGGCALARDPEQIRVGEIIEVLEGPLAAMYCLDPEDDDCPKSHHCGLQDLWLRVEAAVRGVLETTTLADLVERHRAAQTLLWPAPVPAGTRRASLNLPTA